MYDCGMFVTMSCYDYKKECFCACHSINYVTLMISCFSMWLTAQQRPNSYRLVIVFSTVLSSIDI